MTHFFEWTPHSDYRQEQVDGLVGREPWRQARLTDATGPTGPTGVVQNMASPTGPYDALVESSLCWSGSPGLIVRTAAWGFSQSGYNDGTFRIYALANQDFSRGVWVELDAPPETTYPRDAVYGPPLNAAASNPRVLWSAAVTLSQIAANPTFVMDGAYVEAERPLFVQTGWYMRGYASEFTGGALRVTIGQGSTAIAQLHGLTPMAGTEGNLVRTTAFAAIQAFEPVEQMLSESQQVSVGIQVGYGPNVSNYETTGLSYETTIPVAVTAENLLGAAIQHDPATPQDLFFRQGIRFQFDAARGLNAYPTPPANFTSIPLGCTVHQATLHGRNRTNSYMPTGATGPHLNRLAYYGSHKGDRPDLHQPVGNDTNPERPSAYFVDTYAVDGPQWHEDAIIHDTYPLAQNGAKHKFTLTFAQVTPQNPTNDQRIANVGVTNGEQFSFYPNFRWFVGGRSITFFPMCAGRNLLPRMYASGFNAFPATTISSLPRQSDTAIPCDVDIQPMCHAFAFTRKLTATGGLPGSKVTPPAVGGTDFPSVNRIVYKKLPLPGVDGMTPDAFSIFTPTAVALTNHTYETADQPGGLPADWSRPFGKAFFGSFEQIHNLGGVIDLYFNWWFKITIRSLNGNACNYVLYRSPNLSWNFFPISTHTRIQIPLSMDACASLSNGSQINAYSADLNANTFELHKASNWGQFGGGLDYRNVTEGLYGIQFAIA